MSAAMGAEIKLEKIEEARCDTLTLAVEASGPSIMILGSDQLLDNPEYPAMLMSSRFPTTPHCISFVVP